MNNIATTLFCSSGRVSRGQVVRATAPNRNFALALATSSVGVQSVLGVVGSGSTAAGGSAQITLYGQDFVLLEAGLTPVTGQTLYVSAVTAGAATNIAPAAFPCPIGTITDAFAYSVTGGVIADIAPSLIPTSSNSSVALASWSIPVSNATPNIRWYACDLVNGDDSRSGFSDTSMADAGTKAVKTFAQLNAILPVDGAGRNVVVAINAGDYNAPTSFLMGRVGYTNFLVRATCTDATAGSVAFADDANDRNMNGNVTATGMNASGYNPTGAPTTRTIQCLKVGGAAPGFPATEVPIVLPGGARLRFDSGAGTQAALRGIRRTIVQVTGTDTLTVDKLLPAAPIASDTFYIEMPGVKCTILRVSVLSSADNGGMTYISGLQSNGTVSGARDILVSGSVQLANCWFTGAQASTLKGPTVSLNSVYVNIDGTSQDTGGVCRSAGTFSITGSAAFVIPAGTGPYANALSFIRTGTVEIQTAFVTASGLTYTRMTGTAQDANDPDPDCIGTGAGQAAAGYGPSRIIGPTSVAGLDLGTNATIAALDITGMGAKPAIKVRAAGISIVIQGALTGSTGNTDVGLDLSNAENCMIYLPSTPTVTGGVGDIRLAGGQIISWATAVLGLVDSGGNRFVGTRSPTGTIPLSGTLNGGGAQSITYLANLGQGAANQANPFQWPSSNRIVTALRAFVSSNTSTLVVTAELYKNNATTGQKVTYNPTSTGAAVDLAHPIVFSDTDTYDVRVSNTGADAGKLTNIAVALEYAL